MRHHNQDRSTHAILKALLLISLGTSAVATTESLTAAKHLSKDVTQNWQHAADGFASSAITADPQAADILPITGRQSLLLSSFGAFAITRSASTPQAKVTLDQTETSSYFFVTLSRSKTGSIPRPFLVPSDTTRIQNVVPVFTHPQCIGSIMHVDTIKFTVDDQAFSKTNVDLAGKCGDGNGLDGSNVLVHGHPYKQN